MNEFASIKLPDYICSLLRSDMSGNEQKSRKRELSRIIFETPSLQSLFDEFFYDIDPERRFDFIFKSMGWEGIRDRLLNLCLHFQEFGCFDIDAVDYVSEFERIEYKLKPFGVEGFSRLNLLFFYVQSSLILKKGGEEFLQFIHGPKLLGYFRSFKSKIIEIDYIILILFQFDHFLGESEVLKGLDLKESYRYLYGQLDLNEKKILINNCLAYSYSIDDDFFFDLKV